MEDAKFEKNCSDNVVVEVYDTTTGKIVPVEVTPDVAAVLQESQQEIWRVDKAEDRHTYSTDAAVYEGVDYGYEDSYFEPTVAEQIAADLDLDARVKEAWASLTDTQRRRVEQYAKNGHSLTKIAEAEGVSVQTVAESINAALKKFRKILRNGT